jgi:alkylhydroperoxidase family enzyme
MLGLSVGLTHEEMTMLGEPENCPTLDATDRLVLRFSEALTRENRVDDALYAELERRFSRDELVELCVTVAFSALVNRVHATFRTDLDDATEAAVGDAASCSIPRRP